MVKELKDDTFSEAIKTGVSFVKITSPFCGPCKTYAPIFDKFAQDNSDVKCFTINGMEEVNTSIKYGIRNVPVTIIFKDGIEVKRLNGSQTQESLEKIKDFV